MVQQGHQVEALAGYDILDPHHLGLDGLLRRADGPNRQVLHPGKPVGEHHQGLLVPAPLLADPSLHEQGDLVKDDEQAGVALVQ